MNCKVIVVVITLLFSSVLCLAKEQKEFHVNIEFPNSEIDLSKETNFFVNIAIENKGEHVLVPHFALINQRNLKSEAFEITNLSTKSKPIYIGAIAKRAVTPESLVSFPSLATVHSTIDLLKFYHFEDDGVYLIRISKTFHGGIKLTSNYAKVTIKGATPFIHKSSFAKRSVSFDTCDSTQIDTINTQLDNQLDALDTALTYLQNNCKDDDFKLFFGTSDGAQYSKIQSNFININELAVSQNFGFDCTGEDCDPGDYAFVHRNDPEHVIHLCDSFWTADDNQYSFDSKAGTITHEMSHFSDIADTDDIAYGVDDCMELAIYDPISASNNADSHEYFQEYNPHCEIQLNIYANCPEPSNVLPVSHIELTTNVINVNTQGATVTIFDNLVFGNIYVFQTCVAEKLDFDSVIIVRSPSGEYLAGNDDDASTCSFVGYTHASLHFNSVHVSVYKKAIDQSTNNFICTSFTATQRAFDVLTSYLDDSPNSVDQCDFKLVCSNELTFEQIESYIDAYDFIDLEASDLCGIADANADIPFTVDGDNNEILKFFTYCESGNYTFTVSLNGQSCSSLITILPQEPSLDCAYSYVYPNYLVSKCNFGNPAGCDVDPDYYFPDFEYDVPCGSNFKLQASSEYPTASIGDIINYSLTIRTDDGGVATISNCPVEFMGILPTSLYAFEYNSGGIAYIPDTPKLLYNDDRIYFNTVYRLEFTYDLYTGGTKRGLEGDYDFGIFLYSPLGFYSDETNNKVYISPQYNEFPSDPIYCTYWDNAPTGMPGSCDYCCYSYVDFCIPSNSKTVQEGQYVKIVIAAPKDQGSNNNNSSNNKRDVDAPPFDDYVISLGNPHVVVAWDTTDSFSIQNCGAFEGRIFPTK